jgi:hypothetical protein
MVITDKILRDNRNFPLANGLIISRMRKSDIKTVISDFGPREFSATDRLPNADGIVASGLRVP